MTRSIKRGIPFPPPYGKELPLPSDMNSHFELVEKYLALWLKIANEKLLGKGQGELIGQLVNRFFDGLPEQQKGWLEGEDSRWGRKPRAVLVKERALQLAQRGEGEEILKRHADWLEEKFEGIFSSGKETKR